MNKPLLGVSLAVLVLGAAVLLRGRADDSQNAAAGATKAAAMGKPSSEVVLSIAPGVKREPPRSPTASKLSPLVMEWRTTGDFKPIYDRLKALPNPTAEELYVLASILESCARFTDSPYPRRPVDVDAGKQRFAASLSPKAPNRDKRIAAFDNAMRSGCSGIEGVETNQKEFRSLIERSAAGGDPKGQARLLSLEIMESRRDEKGNPDSNRVAPISDEQIERLKRIIGSGDPRALIDATHLMMFGNADVHLRGPDEAPIDSNMLYYASVLAACELGYPCGPNTPQISGGCAFSGNCDAADLRDFLLFYELSPGNAQVAMQYQAQLLRAIREGDWSFFNFHRGPSPGQAAFSRP